MSTALEEKLSYILQEKTNKIIPENIKKGVQIFDILGTLEEGTSGVKLFETQEEMQADKSAKEGDLAVVYRNEINNMTADTQTQFVTFPETVTLQEAFSGSSFTRIRAVDSSTMFEGNISLEQNSFRFDGYSNDGMIIITYTSSDGITYKREQFMSDLGELVNPVDFGTIIQCETSEEWNDNFGKFMQVGGKIFEGLFEYKSYTDMNNYKIIKNINIVQDSSYTVVYDTIENELSLTDLDTINNLISNEINTNTSYTFKSYLLEKIDDKYRAYLYNYNNNCYACDIIRDLQTNNNYIGANLGFNGSERPIYIYEIDISSKTIQLKNTINSFTITMDMNNNKCEYIAEELITDVRQFILLEDIDVILSNDTAAVADTLSIKMSHPQKYKYLLSQNQLTAYAGNLYNAVAYGKDGVIEGTLTKNVSDSFNDTNAEIYATINNIYIEAEPLVITEQNSNILKTIKCIPSDIQGNSLIDLSQLPNLINIFSDNNNLIYIDNFTIPNISSGLTSIFKNCTNLKYIKELNFNTENKNINSMFLNCSNLKSIGNMINSNKVTTFAQIFSGCTNLIHLPSQIDVSGAESISKMFENCTSLVEAPELTNFKSSDCIRIFEGCSSLTTIHYINLSTATNLYGIFLNCPKLSDDSLNIILQMCIDTTGATTKTLANIGLTQEQATKCTTLSNYQSFTEAGWTTGY